MERHEQLTEEQEREELEEQRKRLDQEISSEAPEAEMGVIE